MAVSQATKDIMAATKVRADAEHAAAIAPMSAATQTIKPLPSLSTSSKLPSSDPTGAKAANMAGFGPTPTPAPATSVTPPGPSRSAYQNNAAGEQQYQNAVARHNQANPSAQVPTPASTVGASAYKYDASGNLAPGQTLKSDSQLAEERTAAEQAKVKAAGLDTGDPNVNAQIAQTQTQASTFDSDSKTLENANVIQQGALQDEVVDNAEKQHAAENANLDAVSQAAQEAKTASIEAAVTQGEAGKKIAENKFERDTAILEAQKARTDQAYKDQIIEQQTANTQRTLAAESRIAALGGYGNLTGFREKQFITLQNDKLLNSLVVNRDIADRETTSLIQNVSDTYAADLNQVEATKQKAVADTYDKYVGYVQKIAEDRNLTEKEKYTTINDAAKNYTQNVADIHNKALDARHDSAVKAGAEARGIYQLQQQNLRDNAYPLTYQDNAGNVTTIWKDKRDGHTISQETINSIGAAVLPLIPQFNPYTNTGSYLDPITHQVVMLGSSPYAATVNNNVPPGFSAVGATTIPNDKMTEIFEVGSKGKWCGEYVNDFTDGPNVGSNWSDKIKYATIKPGKDAASANLIQPGMSMVLPIWKKTGPKWGHDTLITNWNPTTRTISTVQSNGDGKKLTQNDGLGTVTTQDYNLDQLIQDYGDNFGIIPTTFKAGIQKQLGAAAIPFGPPNVAKPTSTDLPDTHPEAVTNLGPQMLSALQDISQGNHTINNYPWADPAQAYIATQNIKKYDPNYNEALRTANAAQLGPAVATLAQLKASEQSAGASLDQLSSAHSKLPVNSKITALNNLLNQFEGGLSQPEVAAFRAQAADTMGQVGLNITGGNAVNEGLAQALKGGLGSGLNQEAFDKAIQAIKNTMANKVTAQADIVNSLSTGKSLADLKTEKTTVYDDVKTLINKAAGIYTTTQIVDALKRNPAHKTVVETLLKTFNEEQVLEYFKQQ